MHLGQSLAEFIAFAIRVVVGALAAVVVLGVAFALAEGVHWLQARGSAPTWLLSAAQIVEMVIFAADMFGFALFVASEVIKSVQSFFAGLKEPQA